MTPELALIITLSLTGGFIALLAYERARSVRHLRVIRTALDQLVVGGGDSLAQHIPRINRHFVRQLFHYLIHLIVALLLLMVRKAEAGLRAVSRINRRKAVKNLSVGVDTHLREIAAHKEEVALTEKQKKARKDAALRGDERR